MVPRGPNRARELCPTPRTLAELEALARLKAIRDTLDHILIGGWALDSEVLLLLAALLDAAGAWTIAAERAARQEAA